MHVLIFIKLPIEKSMNLSFPQITTNIKFNSKPFNVSVLRNKSQRISKLNQKIQCIRWLQKIKHERLTKRKTLQEEKCTKRLQF
jgi:hypothetical protein